MIEINVIPGHPKTCLYFILRGELTNEVASAFETHLISIANRRLWVIDAPELLDYIEEKPGGTGESHTYGCTLLMYSALPLWGQKLPRQVDVMHFEEVSLVVKELCHFSSQFNCQFVLQLDETHVGEIQNGSPDESIRIGLLAEWEKALGL